MIKSILDNDLYKFTMQQAVLELFPDVDVEYKFINRGYRNFPVSVIHALKSKILVLQYLKLTDDEYDWLKNIPFLKPMYLEYLKNYRFNLDEVKISYNHSNSDTVELSIIISGKWHSTILWEVVLMSLLSECYFEIFNINYDDVISKVEDKTIRKGIEMDNLNIPFADFGTRRRYSHDVQDCVVNCLAPKNMIIPFTGTSNVYFAKKYNIKAIGTMAHEWIMGNSVLESLRHANYRALDNWTKVYKGDLGIALTDTYGTDAFLANFNKRFAREFDGVRHDSGCPYIFTKKIIAHYEKHGIDPNSKTIVYSDGLDIPTAIEIYKRFNNDIKCSFGIGTNLTNDVGMTPLNIVIKLSKVNGIPVVKLSDVDGKNTGDKKVIEYTKKVINGEL